MGSISIWHWLIVLMVVTMVFGTKKLSSIGGDLGSAVKGFKEGLCDVGDADKAHMQQDIENVNNSSRQSVGTKCCSPCC